MKNDLLTSFRGNGKNLALKTVKNKIEQFISSGIYTDLEEFLSDNPDLETFQSHTKLNNTLRKVWGYQITEQEYQEILETLKQELADRKKIDMENVQTIHANGKELTTYQSEEGTMVLDNSYNQKDMEKQLTELQDGHKQFQIGGDKNIDAMMDYMQEEIKPEVGFVDISSIPTSSLSEPEKRNLHVAKNYQEKMDIPTQVDVTNGLIMQSGNISTIEERDYGMGVFSTETIQPTQQEMEKTEKPKVRTLQMLKQTGFSNALILAFITGVFLGFIFLSTYAKTILP